MIYLGLLVIKRGVSGKTIIVFELAYPSDFNEIASASVLRNVCEYDYLMKLCLKIAIEVFDVCSLH